MFILINFRLLTQNRNDPSCFGANTIGTTRSVCPYRMTFSRKGIWTLNTSNVPVFGLVRFGLHVLGCYRKMSVQSDIWRCLSVLSVHPLLIWSLTIFCSSIPSIIRMHLFFGSNPSTSSFSFFVVNLGFLLVGNLNLSIFFQDCYRHESPFLLSCMVSLVHPFRFLLVIGS